MGEKISFKDEKDKKHRQIKIIDVALGFQHTVLLTESG